MAGFLLQKGALNGALVVPRNQFTGIRLCTPSNGTSLRLHAKAGNWLPGADTPGYLEDLPGCGPGPSESREDPLPWSWLGHLVPKAALRSRTVWQSAWSIALCDQDFDTIDLSVPGIWRFSPLTALNCCG